MTKVNLGAELKDLHGETIREDMRVQLLLAVFGQAVAELPTERQEFYIKRVEEMQKPLTVWTALVQVTGAPIDGLTPEETGKVFMSVAGLALNKNGEAELEANDVTLLQKACGKVYKQPIVAGQLHALLDGKEPFSKPGAPEIEQEK